MENKLQVLISECLILIEDIPTNRNKINSILDDVDVDYLIGLNNSIKSDYIKIIDSIQAYYGSISNISNPVDTLLDTMNESNKEIYTKYLDTFSKL